MVFRHTAPDWSGHISALPIRTDCVSQSFTGLLKMETHLLLETLYYIMFFVFVFIVYIHIRYIRGEQMVRDEFFVEDSSSSFAYHDDGGGGVHTAQGA